MLATPILLGAGDPPSQVQYAQITIRERVILRVPRTPMPAITASRWKERKGPRCINAQALAGALPGEEGTVDILSLIHISEPTRLLSISYAVFCLKKKIPASICKFITSFAALTNKCSSLSDFFSIY